MDDKDYMVYIIKDDMDLTDDEFKLIKNLFESFENEDEEDGGEKKTAMFAGVNHLPMTDLKKIRDAIFKDCSDYKQVIFIRNDDPITVSRILFQLGYDQYMLFETDGDELLIYIIEDKTLHEVKLDDSGFDL